MGCLQQSFSTRFFSHKTVCSGFNRLNDIDTAVPIGKKLHFLMNSAFILGIAMLGSEFDAISRNALFWSVL